MKYLKLIVPVIILIAGFFLMKTLAGMKEEPPKRTPPPKVKIVSTAVVDLTEVPVQIIAYGRVTSSQPVTLSSEVAGTLQRGTIPFQPGQSFRRGDVLLTIDDRQAQLDLNSAKSDFLNALAAVLPEIKVDFPDEFPLWQAYFDRCNFDESLAELPVVNDQKIKLFLSRFNVYKLYFTIRDLEIRFDKHTIRAPFNGSILTAELRPGSTARVGSLLGTIINLDDLEVEVPIPARDVPLIDYDQSVTFTSSEMPGSWTGQIKRIGKTIDLQTQSVQVFASIREKPGQPLFDSMFLQATIPGQSIPEAISIPQKILYNDQFTYVIENGALAQREVHVAHQELDRVVIDRGLTTGDTLVVDVLQGIAPGMKVQARTTGGSK